ncbi:RNA-guided endonuclease InsQ/TnpB family protein [Lactobacillaceae bacterium Melli_B3]
MKMRYVNNRVRLYPNAHMQRYLDAACQFRRYCWNTGLQIWLDMYDAYQFNPDDNPMPRMRIVRDRLTELKQTNEWMYRYPISILDLTIKDMGLGFDLFFDSSLIDCQKPKLKTGLDRKLGFKTGRARIVNGKLRLDHPLELSKKLFYDIRMRGLRHDLGDNLRQACIHKKNNKYYATLIFEVDDDIKLPPNHKKTAVDVNIGHYDYTGGRVAMSNNKLRKLYAQNIEYRKRLKHKRDMNPDSYRSSKNYLAMSAKLARNHNKIVNIQNDLLHKFTTKITKEFVTTVIEDIPVKKLMQEHLVSDGLQRAIFGRFKAFMTYKSDWYGRKLIKADRYYPSTQRCSRCGHVKKDTDMINLEGNAKHHTDHDQYICYQCGYVADRDVNAVNNLMAY